MLIRNATEQDVPLILELIRALAEYEKLADMVTATEDKLGDALFGPQPAAETLLAYEGDACAGFALYFHNFSTFRAQRGIYLEDLYVKPEFRGRGIGYALLQRLAQLAVERGCARMDWEVLDWNAPSIAFYQRLGAVAMDDWTRYRLTGEALDRLAGG